MQKLSFDAGWEFTDQAMLYAGPTGAWKPVTLPHDASIAVPRSKTYPTGAAGGYAWSGLLNYRKNLYVPAEWKGQVIQLEFEGVYMNAKISVNGNVAALHPYGYTSFLVDIQPYLVFGAENAISVVVNNIGQPNSRWYSGTGIYRHAWLRVSGPLHILPWGVFVTTPVVDPAVSTVMAATEIANGGASPADAILRSTVLDAAGKAVARVETAVMIPAGAVVTARQQLVVPSARLWSLEDPYLYTLASEVIAGGAVVDGEKVCFGIRSIAVDSQNGFRLNGVSLKLKGGCVHHDNGLLGSASYDRAEERKIELMKAAGYNAIRCAHNPPAPAMLDACDRLGLLVIDETFDCWRMGKNPHDYQLYFEDWWQRDTESMVRRDRNHPSIIMWSIGNEVGERTGASDGYAWCQKQADFVRSLDSTRFVTSAVPFLFEEMMTDEETKRAIEADPDKMWDLGNSLPSSLEKDRWGKLTRPFFASLDVGGYNYLCNRYEYDNRQFPERVMCGTETWPHQAYDTWQATLDLPAVIGDFVWTSLDYLGESGIGKVNFDITPGMFFHADPWPYHLANCGDIDICGFKRPQSYYRDILWGVRSAPYIGVVDPARYPQKASFNPWGWEPVSDSWDFPGQEGKPTRVDVYSGGEEVELLVNGVSAGRKQAGAACKNKACFDVTYAPGKVEAVAYSGGKETGRFSLQTAGAPAALRLSPDRKTLKPEYGDLSYVTVEVVDAAGARVKWAAPEVVCEVSGAGSLLAVGAANPETEELYVGDRRTAHEGRLIAVVRTSGAGEIVLKASAQGLAGAETHLIAG